MLATLISRRPTPLASTPDGTFVTAECYLFVLIELTNNVFRWVFVALRTWISLGLALCLEISFFPIFNWKKRGWLLKLVANRPSHVVRGPPRVSANKLTALPSPLYFLAVWRLPCCDRGLVVRYHEVLQHTWPGGGAYLQGGVIRRLAASDSRGTVLHAFVCFLPQMSVIMVCAIW